MAKNKLTDLNDHLFMAMERLNDESLNGEALVEEIERSKAIARISQEIISTGNLVLKARVAVERDLFGVGPTPAMLSTGE